MNSAAFLRRGILPTPPLPASGLPLKFGHVSFNGAGQISRQGCKNGLQIIRCARFSKPPSSSSGHGGFPLANAKMAVQSLLCFSLDTAAEPETQYINAEKKKALQKLLGGIVQKEKTFFSGNNPEKEAVEIMTNLLKKYQKASVSIKYEAALALVQVLIHIGTSQRLGAAIGHLNDIEGMADGASLPSDARRHLYRAVIYTLLEDNGEAQYFWNIYTKAVGSGPPRH